MCAVSAIGDNWKLTFPDRYPNLPPASPSIPGYPYTPFPNINHVSRQEFDQLKAEMAELKKLLLAAKEYDAKTGQPDCETDEKIALIKKIAEMVGVNMDEVFGTRQG